MAGGRIVGMNRRQKPKQLLSVVGNKPRPVKVAKAIGDPPLSSEEEENDEALTDDCSRTLEANNEALPKPKFKTPVDFAEEVDHRGSWNVKDDATPALHFKTPKAFDDVYTSSHDEEGKDAVPSRRLELKVPKFFDDPAVLRDQEAGNKAMTDNQRGVSNAKGQTAANCGPESDRHRDAVRDSPDSSGDERLALASMKQTNFGKATGASKLTRGTRRKSDDTEGPESLSSSSRNFQMSSSKRRRLSDKPPATEGQGTGASYNPSSSGGHQTDELGFTKRKTSKTTYSKKNLISRGQMDNKAAAAATASNTILTVPDPFESPKKSEPAKLLTPKDLPPSSPPESPPGGIVLKHSQDNLSSPEANSVLKSKGYTPSGGRVRPPIRRQSQKSIPATRVPTPPPAVFKLPAQISELACRVGDDNDESNGELSGILSDAENGGGTSDIEVIGAGEDPALAATVCPWCGEPVDRALLEESSKGKRMNVRQQTRFCQKHKKQKAIETWWANGYPDVDWQDMDRRFSEHHALLLDIVNGKSSHFRSILKEKIQSGQARSMKKEDNLNPGYYGPRGFNLMCDYLVNEFGSLLKERAVDDRVIAGRGSAAFIQSVLVAELAVQLIKDDLHLSVDDARKILEESKALGEMVHEEL